MNNLGTCDSTRVEEFLDALTGQSKPDANPFIMECAEVVNEILQHPELNEPKQISNEKLEEFRTKVAQICSEAERPSKVIAFWKRPSTWSYGLAASVLVSIGISLSFQNPAIVNEGIDRGVIPEDLANPEVLVLNPHDESTQLTTRLNELGIEVTNKQDVQPSIVQLEAFIPISREEEVNDLLKKYKISAPQNGMLVIKFKKL